jgi:hypothetical protein
MKRAILLPAVVLLFAAAPGAAQTLELEPAEPGVTADPAEVESQPKNRPSSGSRRMRGASADARHCLDLKTNQEIIKCAERYL